MTMLHQSNLNLPELEGKHYGGTNRGNAITGVKVPRDEEVWTTTYSEKLDIFGSAGRTKMGGSSATAAKCGRQKREPETVEPLMFHCWPRDIYEEYINMFAANTVMDLSPGCGICAEACLRNSKGYVGFCWTPVHQMRMEQRLKLFLLNDMLNESSPLYSPVICEHIDFVQNEHIANDNGSVTSDGVKPGSATKRKAAAKKKAQKAAVAKQQKKKDGEPPAKKKPRMTKADKANPQGADDVEDEDDEDDDEDDEDASEWDLSDG